MNKVIKQKLTNILKNEVTYILNNEENNQEKLKKLDDLFNLQKIINNFDELEPILYNYFKEKAQQDKWEKEK